MPAHPSGSLCGGSRVAYAADGPEDAVTPTVPPIIAAALCIKPRGQLTEEQGKKVDMLKANSAASSRHAVPRHPARP
jgi:hypothetical protein